MNQLTECQIFLTRRCQLSCVGCQVVRGAAKDIQEMTESDWVNAADRLKDLGIKTMKILGGEPTLHPALPYLVERLHYHGIKTALLTNGLGLTNEDGSYSELYDRLAPYLHAVFPSVDSKRSPFARKNGPGWAVIEWAKARGIPLVAANVAVGRLNLDTIYEVVSELVAVGCRINLSAYNYLRADENQEDFHFRMAVPKPLQWDDEDNAQAARFAEVIEYLKDFETSFAGGLEYLEKVQRYGFDQSWECDSSNQLRLDAMVLGSAYQDRA